MKNCILLFTVIISLCTASKVYGQEIFKSELIGVEGYYDFRDSTVNIEIYNKSDSVIYLRDDSEHLYSEINPDSGIITIGCSSVLLPQLLPEPWPSGDGIEHSNMNTIVLLPKDKICFKYLGFFPDDSLSHHLNLPIDSFRINYTLDFLVAKKKIDFKTDLPNYFFVQNILRKDLNVYRFYGSLMLNSNKCSENCYSLLIEEIYFNGEARIPNLLNKESKKRVRQVHRLRKKYGRKSQRNSN
jgi:hypothetical protein